VGGEERWRVGGIMFAVPISQCLFVLWLTIVGYWCLNMWGVVVVVLNLAIDSILYAAIMTWKVMPPSASQPSSPSSDLWCIVVQAAMEVCVRNVYVRGKR
jgi:hypothetical protein